ncbi:hypothetical protein G6O69_07065 [Pseudenhygromyxa sp. WMMC2535]|uniref:hypothetical protein n=1 Tax=Pseudenhygromyxa sp. WMMC2535 TaxID=2712867 RepID=UPI001553DD3C|nr:hypothetical protein [Pseudenhygromyxa sp. WMMC2535]NVB37587.1 hypothetical protein [Pseudenhygromyxa sp. WMMC2535]
MRAREKKALVGAALGLALIAGAVFVGTSLLPDPPRCDAAALEALGRELSALDPGLRLDRTQDVVDALHGACEIVTWDTATFVARVHGEFDRGQAYWEIVDSPDEGCSPGSGGGLDPACAKRCGYPEEVLALGLLENRALRTQLMLEEVGVSSPAARQLVWVMVAGEGRKAWFDPQPLRSPLTELSPPSFVAESPTPIGPGQRPTSSPGDALVIDGRARVDELRGRVLDKEIRAHAVSIAHGDAFPFDVWIPITLERRRLRACATEQGGLRCLLPHVAGERAATLAALVDGELEILTPVEPAASGASAPTHLLVLDERATWAEIIDAATQLAPEPCRSASTACSWPWLSLWLNVEPY